MANELDTKKSKKRSIQEIMRDKSAKTRLQNLVDEAVKIKEKIHFEQENLKALRSTALEELGLEPKLFNNYVAMLVNNDYEQRKDGLEEQLTLVEIVLNDITGQISE